MLVLSRKTNQVIRIRRKWLRMADAPVGTWILGLVAGNALPVIARQHTKGGAWINDDLREIADPVGWQPLPKRDEHPEGEQVAEIVVVEIRGDKTRIGIQAPEEFSIHRKEVDDAARENTHECP